MVSLLERVVDDMVEEARQAGREKAVDEFLAGVLAQMRTGSLGPVSLGRIAREVKAGGRS